MFYEGKKVFTVGGIFQVVEFFVYTAGVQVFRILVSKDINVGNF
jgi:hypothetical protein